MKKLLVAGLILGSLAAPAMAADLAVKAAPPAPYLWNGLYVGLNAGYADEQSTFTTAATATPDAALGVLPNITESLAAMSSGRIPTNNGMGFIGGGQVGYNLQLTPLWVVGIETDIRGKTGSSNGSISGGDLVGLPLGVPVPVTSTQTVSAKTDWLGTVRGRFGMTLGPTWLVYFTGGLAYGGSSVSSSLMQSGTSGFAGAGSGSLSTTRMGGAFGAGLEWMFAQRWSAKAEYLFYDLGTASFSYAATQSFFPVAGVYQTVANSVHFQGNIARLGINYHF